MKSVNLFVLSRSVPDTVYQDFECALSGRDKPIKYRTEEIDLIRDVIRVFIHHKASESYYDGWFYSFTIPQVGKEFDLLRITENSVINLELKSRPVDEGKIEKQLIQNRYYLAHLKKEIYSFTLVRDEDLNLHLFRYKKGLIRSSFDELCEILDTEMPSTTENIEELFDPCVYLVSPINTPYRFLNREYFLNTQQSYIKSEIKHSSQGLFGIKGSAGTGKTLLLYDIAMELGKTRKTCVVHSGILSDGHNVLAQNEDSFTIIESKNINNEVISTYEVICIDETQRLYTRDLDTVLEAYDRGIAKLCVFSYDYQQSLSVSEIQRNNPQRLNSLDDFKEYTLTDKIRTNDGISSFIRTMLHLYDVPKKQIAYDRIDIVYANSIEELKCIIGLYVTKGYEYIPLTSSLYVSNQTDSYRSTINSHLVIGQEYDKVIVVMDENFKYDESGTLTAKKHPDPDYLFERLFYQNITRARKRLCLVVFNNPLLLERLLGIKNYTLNYRKPDAENKKI